VFNKQAFFTNAEKEQIVQAIQEAERMTSGEIRVHLEKKCNGDAYGRALEVFMKLKMNETAKQNATLIYLAYEDKKFAIIGDKGINEVVPTDFWDSTKHNMEGHFKQSQFKEGIIYAITETGKHLKAYFPFLTNDKNELSNEISEE